MLRSTTCYYLSNLSVAPLINAKWPPQRNPCQKLKHFLCLYLNNQEPV